MPFGYTFLDPLVVLLGTALAGYFLSTNPIRLMAWLPSMLVLYFFIPFLTLLTLSQTIPLLLAGRAWLKGQLQAYGPAKPVLFFLLVVFGISAFYGLLLGQDGARSALRILYYVGVFAVMSFTYEMARIEGSYELFLKGLVLLGIALSVYGLYQIVAVYTGLPFRGILRGVDRAQAAFEGSFFRINSLASEPKRLGYVMFVCALACLFLAQVRPQRALWLKCTGAGILAMSILTFAASYFVAIIFFALAASFLYPSKFLTYIFGLGMMLVAVQALSPEFALFDAIQEGFGRRSQEFEVGLDGQQVYRQEFFAWDYLDKHPEAWLYGVGLGQYFQTFSSTYGFGAGISADGTLLPLNSSALELLFDFGGIATAAFYGAIFLLILALRKKEETFVCLALLFVVVQSFTILTLNFVVLFAGIGAGRLALARLRLRQVPARSLTAKIQMS